MVCFLEYSYYYSTEECPDTIYGLDKVTESKNETCKNERLLQTEHFPSAQSQIIQGLVSFEKVGFEGLDYCLEDRNGNLLPMKKTFGLSSYFSACLTLSMSGFKSGEILT